MTQRIGLGEFEVLILAATLKLGDGAYGAAIYRSVESAGRPATIGAVYTTLYRLEERGLVTSEEGDPTPVRGGRAKRYYALEPAGRDALSESVRPIRNLLRGTELAFG